MRFSGEAIYEIGVEDNGLMTGLSDEDMDSSLDTLREMARRLGATIQVLRERVVTTEHGTRTVSEVLVRKVGPALWWAWVKFADEMLLT